MAVPVLVLASQGWRKLAQGRPKLAQAAIDVWDNISGILCAGLCGSEQVVPRVYVQRVYVCSSYAWFICSEKANIPQQPSGSLSNKSLIRR